MYLINLVTFFLPKRNAELTKEKEKKTNPVNIICFAMFSFFNDIPAFVGYLMSKASFQRNSSGTI